MSNGVNTAMDTAASPEVRALARRETVQRRHDRQLGRSGATTAARSQRAGRQAHELRQEAIYEEIGMTAVVSGGLHDVDGMIGHADAASIMKQHAEANRVEGKL